MCWVLTQLFFHFVSKWPDWSPLLQVHGKIGIWYFSYLLFIVFTVCYRPPSCWKIQYPSRDWHITSDDKNLRWECFYTYDNVRNSGLLVSPTYTCTILYTATFLLPYIKLEHSEGNYNTALSRAFDHLFILTIVLTTPASALANSPVI